MKTISSTDNPLYKSLGELNTARGRREQGLFIAEGPHLVEEALKSGAAIRYIAFREDSAERHDAILQAAVASGAEALMFTPRLFNALCGTESPQGILTAVSMRKYKLDELDIEHDTLAIVLERIQDPGNLGTILRTALAVSSGFAVITTDSADPWSQKVVRASQGAVFYLPIVEMADAAGAVTLLNGYGWHTACGHLAGLDFFGRASHGRTALVIGNEAAGVSASAAEACSARYILPMPGPAESLNAAVAAGIMLYDIWKEQKTRH